jgi:sugar/nucleoside kinase (ribokinase family)
VTREEMRDAGVLLDHVHRSAHPTRGYTAVLDAFGQRLVAIAAMSANDLRPAARHNPTGWITGSRCSRPYREECDFPART